MADLKVSDSLLFSSRSLIIIALTFRSITHFKLTFVYGLIEGFGVWGFLFVQFGFVLSSRT